LAKADIYLTDCAVLDTPGETYYLTQDIINSTASTCMNIQVDNVTLDCQNHIIEGVGDVDTYGIYALVRTNVTIKNCVVTDWYYGIYLSCSNSTSSNIAVNSNYEGIYLVNSNFNNLTNITGNFNLYAIDFYRSNNNTLSNIVANLNYAGGITFGYSNNNTLSNITANSNVNYGIAFEDSNFNNLTDITTNFNDKGIDFYQTSSNTLSNIISSSNNYGFYIRYSVSNTIKNSIIQNNTEYGIYLQASGDPENLIYNNLFNNTNNIYFDEGIYANNWNTTRQTGSRIYSLGTEIGGNYWTNPDGNGYSDTCTDADKDGFCDDPFVLATDNVDYLALSDEYSPPTTTTLPPVHGVPLLSSTLVGIVIGSGIIIFMLRTLFDITMKGDPKKIIEYFIVLAVIVLTVLSLIALFA
jgi:parallel beta-helix repeat protein